MSYDTPIQQQFTTGSVAATIGAIGEAFAPDDIVARSSITEQPTKLGYMMNMYEYFQFESVDFTFIPRFTGPNSILPYLYDTSSTNPYLGYVVAALVESAEMCFVTTKDETFVRPTLEEYYQVRATKRAHCFKPTERFSIKISPYTLDSIQLYSHDQTNAINRNNAAADFTNNTNPIPASAMALNNSQPVKIPWLSTKVAFWAPGGSGVPAQSFNDQMSCNGIKIYLYTPNNVMPNAGTGTTVYGITRADYHYRFKDPDYRALISGLALMEKLNTQNEKNTLRQVLGEQLATARSMGSTFIPMTENGAVRKAIQDSKEPAPDPKKQKTNPTAPQGPPPSYQRTPLHQIVRGPPAGPGSK